MMAKAFDSVSDTIRSVEVASDDDRTFLSIERRMKIAELVNANKTASVAEIIDWLGASPATVRRDLLWLDEQGLIIRTRGGATALDYPAQIIARRTTPAYEQRLNEYIEEKRAIGQCAAGTIHDGETIILDA